MKISLIAFNCRYSHSCLALFYVRNELEKFLSASTISIKQFTINDPYYETLLKIKDEQTEALFFSVYIWNATYLCRLLNDLHSCLPNIPIVIGGPQAPSLREKLSFVPTLVHDQIEGVDQNFYKDLANNNLLKDYFSSPITTFGYPYKQEDFQGQLKNRNIYYESSRGCPFFCTYCLSSISHGVLSKDVEQVKKELSAILKESPKNLRFVDRTFNANPKRALEIWRFLCDTADNTCSFHFEIAPDLFTEDMFCFLKGVKRYFFQFEIGIQSTNQETLFSVNRKMNIIRSINNIRRLISFNNIDIHIDLILGLPFEDSSSFSKSVNDVLMLMPNNIQIGLLKILPDTEIFKNKQNFEFISCADPPFQILSSKWINGENLSKLYWIGECIESFYNKKFFKNFFSYLLYREKDIFIFFKELTFYCQTNNFFNLSKTHEYMNIILFNFIENHKDNIILKEFLIFDWLSCGHRYLHDIFNIEIDNIKHDIINKFPLEMDNIYKEKERNFFLKKCVFFKFSYLLLSHIKLSKLKCDLYVAFFKENKNCTNIIVMPPLID